MFVLQIYISAHSADTNGIHVTGRGGIHGTCAEVQYMYTGSQGIREVTHSERLFSATVFHGLLLGAWRSSSP
jgi:hypothetical protein